MKKIKTARFKEIPASQIFYALSDPVRIEIVQALLKTDETSCGDCKTALSKSTMSHHFKVLRENGLIEKRTIGTTHFISLRQNEIEKRMPGLLLAISRLKNPI